MAALHMFSALEAIEELADALVRLEDGRYGSCPACDRPIPIGRGITKAEAALDEGPEMDRGPIGSVTGRSARMASL
jgi:hypothetical protein